MNQHNCPTTGRWKMHLSRRQIVPNGAEFSAIEVGMPRKEAHLTRRSIPSAASISAYMDIHHKCQLLYDRLPFDCSAPLFLLSGCGEALQRRPERHRPGACNLYKHWELRLWTPNPGTTAEHAHNNKIYSIPCIKRHAAHSRNTCCISPFSHLMFAGGDQKQGAQWVEIIWNGEWPHSWATNVSLQL